MRHSLSTVAALVSLCAGPAPGEPYWRPVTGAAGDYSDVSGASRQTFPVFHAHGGVKARFRIPQNQTDGG